MRIGFVGDIMCGSMPFSFDAGLNAIYRTSLDSLFYQLCKLSKDVSFFTGNLEGVISEKTQHLDEVKANTLRGKAELLDALKQAGFAFLSIANNHVLDHGLDAFHDTI